MSEVHVTKDGDEIAIRDLSCGHLRRIILRQKSIAKNWRGGVCVADMFGNDLYFEEMDRDELLQRMNHSAYVAEEERRIQRDFFGSQP